MTMIRPSSMPIARRPLADQFTSCVLSSRIPDSSVPLAGSHNPTPLSPVKASWSFDDHDNDSTYLFTIPRWTRERVLKDQTSKWRWQPTASNSSRADHASEHTSEAHWKRHKTTPARSATVT